MVLRECVLVESTEDMLSTYHCHQVGEVVVIAVIIIDVALDWVRLGWTDQ
jgi:hypothetical protein